MPIKILTIITLYLCSYQVKAADIVMADVTGIHGKQIGSYNGAVGGVFKALKNYIETQTDLTFQPMNAPRAYRLFYINKVQCVTPGSVDVNVEEKKIVGSKPLATVRWVVFSNSKPIVDNLKGFEDLLIGIPYDKDGMQNILPEGNYNYVVNHDNYRLANQLKRGRIDAMIMVWEEYQSLVRDYGEFKDFLNAHETPLYVQKLGVICNQGPKSKYIIDTVNEFAKFEPSALSN
ncbi:hypothetical protein [Sneathiella limimaris]|uniref:hypothetical protein n=1 Tax=Sneathiella limimaris TaxID=1964213 RepID=UPI00146BF0FB|nr:hypothetical protein [Sneathiella limimaris]